MSEEVPSELANSVSKLVELTKQITEARDDIKILTQAEKAMRLQIKKIMVDNGLDTINLKKGKIAVRKKMKKASMNKTSVKEGLSIFFNGNEAQVEGAINAILDNIPETETSTLSITGIKEKKQEQ
jgi:hypothetical protein